MAEVLDRTRDADSKKKSGTPTVDEAGNILSQISDQEIEWVDLRFTDPKGKCSISPWLPTRSTRTS